jgi:protein TonB
MRIAGLLSLAVHAAVIGGLLLWFGHRSPPANGPETQGAVELVMLEQQGAGLPTAPREAAAPAIAPAPLPAPPEAPKPSEEAEPLPSPPVPSSGEPAKEPSPAPRPVQPAQEAPQINIGGTDSETNAIVLASPQVIPASIDAKFRNREPVYPRDAVRRAEQGAVILLIHVSPQGLTGGVDILESSGFQSLDRAARDAVWGWHFLPAMRDGQPVPFDMTLRVSFRLD